MAKIVCEDLSLGYRHRLFEDVYTYCARLVVGSSWLLEKFAEVGETRVSPALCNNTVKIARAHRDFMTVDLNRKTALNGLRDVG
jgi:hypothetical protein